MASYRISLRPAAERDLRKIDPTIRLRIWNRIRSLAEKPLPRGAEKLTGSEDEYRVRVGTFRILYLLDRRQQSLEVFRIAHRREAYRRR